LRTLLTNNLFRWAKEERMGKEAVVYRAENALKDLSEYGFKRLYTTQGFRLMGIVTWDKKIPDESLGERRRWVKGLKIENGTPIPSDERVFETSLDRKNPLSGELEEIVVHEDDSMILMARKTFDLDDGEENFQFIPNQHMLNRVQQFMDEIEAKGRRIQRLGQEKEQFFQDAEHFKREGITAKEREKTNIELLNRLTRDGARLQERIGNLESQNQVLRARNVQYESQMDEIMANSQEEGTIKGMNTDDLVIHAIQKTKDKEEAMMDIQQEDTARNEQIQEMAGKLQDMKAELSAMKNTGQTAREAEKQA